MGTNLFFVIFSIVIFLSFLIYFKKNAKIKKIEKLKKTENPLVLETSPVNLRPLMILKKINFDEISDLEKMSLRIRTEQFLFLNNQLKILNIGIQLADATHLTGVHFAKFTNEVQNAINKGQYTLMNSKDGAELMIAVNKESGQIVKHAEKIGNGFHNVAQVTNLIVNVSHIIAGYDNAMKLKGIDSKLDKLLRFRQQDMNSEFKAAYEELQSIIALDEESSECRQRLRYVQVKLRHLRVQWISEVKNGLEFDVNDPLSYKFINKYFFKATNAKEVSDQVYKSISPLYLVRSILEIERFLSIALMEEEVFESVTIQNTILDIEEIGHQLRTKEIALSKYLNDGGKQVQLLIENSENMIESLKKAG